MKKSKALVGLLSTFLLTSTALAKDQVEIPTKSDFIEDLPALEVAADDPDLFRWSPPGGPPAGYDKLMITQPEIFLAEDNRYKGLQPDQLKLLADSVAEAIATRMSDVIEVVDTRGPNTMVLEMALTDLKMKRKRSVLGYVPIGAVVHAVAKNRDTETAEVAKKIILVNARLEAELVDGVSGERLGVNILVITRKQKDREEESWEALKEEIEDLADRFHANFLKYKASQTEE